MPLKQYKIMVGLIIILLGVLLLLNNIHLLRFESQIWWGITFCVLGFIFVNVFRYNKAKKGLLVMGIIFLLIGIFCILDSLNIISDDLICVFVLWTIGAMFILFYVRQNNRWWAVIIGGALLISGSLILIDELRILSDVFFGFIFLLGMSLVFWFLYLIREEKNKMEWTKVIALILLVAAFFALANEWDNSLADILFPLAIIFCGGFLIIKSLLINKKKKEIE